MLRFLLGIFVFGCAIIISISLYTFLLYTHPKRYITPITPSDLGLDYEDISLQTTDSVTLSGWFIPNKGSQSAIIICHGYPADKGDLLQTASFLAPRHNLLFFDFRGLGQSRGGSTTLGNKERLDLLCAVDYLKSKGFDRIGAFGFSMGGAVIIMSNSPDIKAAVVDSAFSDLRGMVDTVYESFGPARGAFTLLTDIYSKLFMGTEIKAISPISDIKDLSFPLFIIHAQNDDVIPVENAHALHRENMENRLWIVPNASHGQTSSINEKEYEKNLTAFFDEHL